MAGAFTPREESDIFNAIADIKTREHVERVLAQMVTAGVSPDELTGLGGLGTEFVASATTQAGIDDEARFIAENQPRYGGVGSLGAEQQAAVAAGLTPSGGSWEDIRDGITGAEGEEEVKGLDRLRYYKDEDFILDRSTGNVMSEQQWAVLKRQDEIGEAARAEYLSVRAIGEVATRLIESGKFTGDLTRNVRKEYIYGPDGKKVLDDNGNPKYRTVRPMGTDENGDTRTVKAQPNTQFNPKYIWKTEGYYDTAMGRYVTKRVRVKNPDYKYVSRNYLPVEDIATPSPVVNEAWEAPSYDYSVGGGRAEWLGFTPRQRNMRVKYMENVGILTSGQVEAMGGYAGTPLNFAVMDIWENVSAVSSQLQYSQFDAMNAIGVQIAMNKATQTSSGGYRSSGGGGPTYSVPASLREVPDYKTLAERTKSVFDSELGRDMEDWELALLSDELGDKYAQANRQRIDIHKNWWDDSVSGGTTDVDFTEVEEPEEGLMFDIGEKYEAEINRNVRVEDRANNRNLLMNSIAVGERMI